MKCIIYNRTSTDDQHPENQIKDCLAVCERIGIKDYEIVQETESAWKDDKKRIEFKKVYELINKGKLDVLVVWDLDRIYRNRKKQVAFFQLCKGMGCKVYSYRQKFLEDINKIPEPWDEIITNFMIEVMGWMAEDESKKKSERVRAAYNNRKKKWGRKPLDNVEGKVIELYNKGRSMREIASEVYYWDSARNKKYVSKSAVHKIITKFKANNS